MAMTFIPVKQILERIKQIESAGIPEISTAMVDPFAFMVELRLTTRRRDLDDSWAEVKEYLKVLDTFIDQHNLLNLPTDQPINPCGGGLPD